MQILILKKAWMAISTSDEVDFRAKKIRRQWGILHDNIGINSWERYDHAKCVYMNQQTIKTHEGNWQHWKKK